MKRAIRDAGELCHKLSLPSEVADEARRATGDFPLFAPRPYVARMRRGDIHDPLLRQVLPMDAENEVAPGFVADPVADHAAVLAPGLLHKYHGRVLLVTTGACAVHCRYCFRRHYPYAEVPKSVDAWAPAIEKIATDASIGEVILSGGDPLTLADERLGELVSRLECIDHLRVLRIHTRLPIMIPQRVDDALVNWLAGTRFVPYVVIHANHAAEIDEHVGDAIERLQAAGAAVLNQSVLLAGVNDSVEALEELSRRLVELRVQPYYLHQLDRVDGAAHFEVPIERGTEIMKALHERLPGYAVPRYVEEVPGAEGKTKIG